MIYSSSQTWMHTSAVAKTQTTHKRKAHRHANRMISYSLCFLPLFFEPHSLLPLIHPHTQKYTQTHTHINSPLGVCCFHYLQLGPETAFRVEYSRAELARIAVYIARSLVIASSLFSLSCASGGKYESVVSGDHPCCAAPHLTTTVCPPTGHK